MQHADETAKFIRKLKLFAHLQPRDIDQFLGLIAGRRDVAEGVSVFEEGDTQDNIYIVAQGWFYSYAILPDGSRQIHEIFAEGDVVGADHMSWSHATSSVAAASDGVLLRLPVANARKMMMAEPRLSSVFYSMYMLNSVLLLDRITAVARLGAYKRMCYFFLDMLTRQNTLLDVPTNRIDLPLSQNFIADCLGLSSVHVSRQFGKLIQNGLIEKDGRYGIIIRDADRLRKLSDYHDRYGDIDRVEFDVNFGQSTAMKDQG